MDDTSVFVGKLKESVYDKLKLSKEGFSNEYSSSLIEAFYLSKTKKQSLRSNVLLQLIEEYNCDAIALFSSISFSLEVNEIEKYFLIGWVWGEDLLAIDKSNGEIVILAYWDYNLITFYCALNGNKFLDAFLIHGISPLDRHFEDREEQRTHNINKAKEAANIAGGDRYLKFWMALYPTENGKSDEPNKEVFLN